MMSSRSRAPSASRRSAARFLIQSKLVPDRIREHGKCPHTCADIRARRQDAATRRLNFLEGVGNHVDHDVGPGAFLRGAIALLDPGATHPTSIIEGQLTISTFPDLPAEDCAVEVRGRLGSLRWYFQITNLAVGHHVSSAKCREAPPNSLPALLELAH